MRGAPPPVGTSAAGSADELALAAALAELAAADAAAEAAEAAEAMATAEDEDEPEPAAALEAGISRRSVKSNSAAQCEA